MLMRTLYPFLLLEFCVCAAFGVCAYCGVFANIAAGLVMWLHGLDVAPSWDRPWLVSAWARCLLGAKSMPGAQRRTVVM